MTLLLLVYLGESNEVVGVHHIDQYNATPRSATDFAERLGSDPALIFTYLQRPPPRLNFGIALVKQERIATLPIGHRNKIDWWKACENSGDGHVHYRGTLSPKRSLSARPAA